MVIRSQVTNTSPFSMGVDGIPVATRSAVDRMGGAGKAQAIYNKFSLLQTSAHSPSILM